MLGKGGVYSMQLNNFVVWPEGYAFQLQIMRADEDHRVKTSKEGRKRFSKKSIEEKDRFFDGKKKYWVSITEIMDTKGKNMMNEKSIFLNSLLTRIIPHLIIIRIFKLQVIIQTH